MPCLPDLVAQTCINNTLEKTQKYLGAPELFYVFNQQRFDSNAYGDKTIVKELSVKAYHMDISKPKLN